ncbi:MAG: protein kinase [Deltaproteobacteria bacterium]|nr:protein kinase [Deltaproteobacteria bacterium]
MPNDRWQRIEEIFTQVVKIPPGERENFLDQRCGDDSDLRHELEVLVRSDEIADQFLAEPSPLPEPTPLAPPLSPSERLGAYRVVRQIGEGGMGTVFLAERDDGSFTLQVAIKVLRHGTESTAAVERLERERRILASLEHPAIARLLDGGTTDSGLPYVVMELVEGEPIDRFCQQHQLSVSERIDLILQICDAVTAAHHNLVIHRDIKPSNILIDMQGRPKLLDFGIAKLVEPEVLPGAPQSSQEGSSTADVTATWDRRLTPSHASPEQLRGDRITVATDVYLLGVVLYEMLTGQLPHRFEGASLAEVEQTLTTRRPPKPSSLKAGVDADLDAIVLKSLRPEPAERYASVEALAEDLRRRQQGLPVAARRGTASYLASRFVRRHSLVLAAASLFVALIIAFGVYSAVQANRLGRTVQRLESVEGFLVDLFWTADPSAAKGKSIPVEEVLQRGERRLAEGSLKEAGSRGLLHALFGRISLHLGNLEAARQHLEEALRAYGEIPGDPSIAGPAALARGDLAMVSLFMEEDLEAAEELALQAVELGRQLPSDQGRETLLELLNNLSHIYCWQRDWDQAALVVEEAQLLVNQRDTVPDLQTANTLGLRALLLRKRGGNPIEGSTTAGYTAEGNTIEARQAYQESLEIYRRLEGQTHPDIAVILNQLALLAKDEGDLKGATESLQEALEIRRALYPKGHWEIAQSLYQLAITYRQLGDLVQAEELFREADEIYSDDPDRGPGYSRAGLVRCHLAEVQLALGQVGQAQVTIDAVPPEWWTARKTNSTFLAICRRAKGCVLAAQGQVDEANPLLEASLQVLTERYGDDGWQTKVARDCRVSPAGSLSLPR